MTPKGRLEDGRRDGAGLVSSPDRGITSLTGEWVEGRLEGEGRLVEVGKTLTNTTTTTVLEGWFHAGCLHGPARQSAMKKYRVFKQVRKITKQTNL